MIQDNYERILSSIQIRFMTSMLQMIQSSKYQISHLKVRVSGEFRISIRLDLAATRGSVTGMFNSEQNHVLYSLGRLTSIPTCLQSSKNFWVFVPILYATVLVTFELSLFNGISLVCCGQLNLVTS